MLERAERVAAETLCKPQITSSLDYTQNPEKPCVESTWGGAALKMIRFGNSTLVAKVYFCTCVCCYEWAHAYLAHPMDDISERMRDENSSSKVWFLLECCFEFGPHWPVNPGRTLAVDGVRACHP